MRQELVQEQKLQQKMNHSLLQAIQILQLSSIEMIEYIQSLANENPLIEDINFDYEISTYKEKYSSYNPIEEVTQQPMSMYDELKEQLVTIQVKKDIKEAVYFGIDSLDENGYLTIDLSMLANHCSISESDADEALRIIQSLDPAGIGARSLSECIIIQLKRMNKYHTYIEELLNQHLNLVANEDVSEIMDIYKVTETEAFETLENIKSCHPKPGTLINTKVPEYVIPEANVYKEEGSWKIDFYQWTSPAIRMNQDYQKFDQLNKETKMYLKEKQNQVEWLQGAIMYRTNTLESVIQLIVEKQFLFFEHGTFMLKPLTLKDLADVLNVHVSTISRTIRNKYIQTNYGTIPLKFFFQSGIKQSNGTETSAFTIKKLIEEIIAYEDKQKPFSDETIKRKLNEEFGIQVARRTVMKYREQLNIPSSMKRKNRGGNTL
ncbi:RNA polymerase factor sigma-54 [Ornithinibacillus halophilus]|uniref:RNA polymerase, sigma 54 subunit, RpoN/SigL n=1 Tax=Ornithinibacillus halophilus TaxID=930117 RepID=A0A1M5F2A1_9BACI|nr:RNA polymerase factor sigma-54 [Ornithinibacillus halophilus]SHF85596.1 RNA polymerase, sigma 54 subunit, RpoN/SigL [Ornithinibacillus halophilus]